MILYKYASFEAGEKIIDSNSMLFSQPKNFNDPFDMPTYPVQPTSDPVSAIFASVQTMGKNFIWAENSGILSLTRTPANALMWAHYSDKHQGMVIGIDTEVAGLTDENSNLIPAQYGSVIYVSRREIAPFVSQPQTPIAVGSTHHFPFDHYEKLQRIFLHKSLAWSYEEEVRVVKCLNGLADGKTESPSGTFSIRRDGERTLHLFTLPSDAICEIYFGFRVDRKKAEAVASKVRQANPKAALYDCILDEMYFSVRATPTSH